MNKTRLLPSAIFIATMGMEMCYLYLGLALVREHLGLNYVAFTLIMLLYPLSLAIELTTANLSGIARRLAPFGSVLTIGLVLTFSALAIWRALVAGYPMDGVLLLVVFCALGWWLGSTIVHGERGYYSISFRFQIGILFLLVFGGVSTLLPVVLFFILAVFALALARRESSLWRSQGVLQGFPFWRIILGSTAVFVPGALIFLAISPEIAGTFVHWFSAVWTRITSLLMAIATSSFWTTPLIQLQPSCACKWSPYKEPSPPPPAPPSNPTTVPPFLLWLLIFAGFLVMLILTRLAIRWLRAQQKARPAKITSFETISIRVNLFRELATFLLKVMKRLWHSLLSILRRAGVNRLRLTSDESIASVRALYRSLLTWAAKQAMSRAPSQTPLEYLGILSQKFPQESRDLAFITEVYLKARYSRRPTTSKEFQAAKGAWQRVKLAL